MLGNIGKAVSSFVKDPVGTAKSAVSSAVSGAKSAAGGAVSAAKSTVSTAKSAVSGKAASAKSAARNTVKTVSEKVTGGKSTGSSKGTGGTTAACAGTGLVGAGVGLVSSWLGGNSTNKTNAAGGDFVLGGNLNNTNSSFELGDPTKKIGDSVNGIKNLFGDTVNKAGKNLGSAGDSLKNGIGNWMGNSTANSTNSTNSTANAAGGDSANNPGYHAYKDSSGNVVKSKNGENYYVNDQNELVNSSGEPYKDPEGKTNLKVETSQNGKEAIIVGPGGSDGKPKAIEMDKFTQKFPNFASDQKECEKKCSGSGSSSSPEKAVEKKKRENEAKAAQSNDWWNKLSNAGKTVTDKLSGAGKTISDGLTGAGKTISDGLSGIGGNSTKSDVADSIHTGKVTAEDKQRYANAVNNLKNHNTVSSAATNSAGTGNAALNGQISSVGSSLSSTVANTATSLNSAVSSTSSSANSSSELRSYSDRPGRPGGEDRPRKTSRPPRKRPPRPPKYRSYSE